MSESHSRISRLAMFAGLAMALGPLTALTVASINNGTAGEYTPSSAVAQSETTAPYFDGKRLSDVAASAGSLDFFSTILAAGQVKDLLRGEQGNDVFIFEGDFGRDLLREHYREAHGD